MVYRAMEPMTNMNYIELLSHRTQEAHFTSLKCWELLWPCTHPHMRFLKCSQVTFFISGCQKERSTCKHRRYEANKGQIKSPRKALLDCRSRIDISRYRGMEVGWKLKTETVERDVFNCVYSPQKHHQLSSSSHISRWFMMIPDVSYTK